MPDKDKLIEVTDKSLLDQLNGGGDQSEPDPLSDEIGQIESNNTYDIGNRHSSAVGKHQFLWSSWGDDIKKVTGVKSRREFRNDPDAQEEYFKHYRQQYMDPAVERLRKYNDSGYSDDQLRKLFHFKGEGGALDWLKNQEDNTSDNNLSIDRYVGKPAGASKMEEVSDPSILAQLNADEQPASASVASQSQQSGQKKSPDVSSSPSAAPSSGGEAGSAPGIANPFAQAEGENTAAYLTRLAGNNAAQSAPAVSPKEKTAKAVDYIAQDFLQSGASKNTQFSNPTEVLKLVTDPHGDPVQTSGYVSARIGALEAEKKRALSAYAEMIPAKTTANSWAEYAENNNNNGGSNLPLATDPQKRKQVEQEYDQKIATLKENAGHIVKLQLFNNEYQNKKYTPGDADRQVQVLQQQKKDQLSKLDEELAATTQQEHPNSVQAQQERNRIEDRKKETEQHFNTALSKVSADTKYDDVRLGIQYEKALGNKAAAEDEVRYNNGQPINPANKVHYQMAAQDVIKSGVENAQANGHEHSTSEGLQHLKDNDQIEKENQPYFNTVRANEISNYLDKNKNPVHNVFAKAFNGAIFNAYKPDKKDIEEAGAALGYTPAQVKGITPEEIKTAPGFVQQFAAKSFKGAGSIYEGAFRGLGLLGIANQQAVNERFQPGWEDKVGIGASIQGESPDTYNQGYSFRNIMGKMAGGIGDIYSILGQAESGTGLLKMIGTGERLAGKAAVFGTAAIQSYNSAYNKSLQVFGDNPEDEAKRQGYSIIQGITGGALMSIAPKSELALDALGSTKAGQDIVSWLKEGKFADITKGEFQNKYARMLVEAGKDLGKQVGLADAQTVASNIGDMVYDKKHQHNLMDNVGETTISTAISMAIPSIKAGIHHPAQQTEMNKALMYEVGSDPAKYSQAIVEQVNAGKMTKEEATKAYAFIGSMNKAVQNVPEENVEGDKLLPQQKVSYAWEAVKESELEKKLKAAEATNDKAQVDAIKTKIKETIKGRSDILGTAGIIPEGSIHESAEPTDAPQGDGVSVSSADSKERPSEDSGSAEEKRNAELYNIPEIKEYKEYWQEKINNPTDDYEKSNRERYESHLRDPLPYFKNISEYRQSKLEENKVPEDEEFLKKEADMAKDTYDKAKAIYEKHKPTEEQKPDQEKKSAQPLAEEQKNISLSPELPVEVSNQSNEHGKDDTQGRDAPQEGQRKDSDAEKALDSEGRPGSGQDRPVEEVKADKEIEGEQKPPKPVSRRDQLKEKGKALAAKLKQQAPAEEIHHKIESDFEAVNTGSLSGKPVEEVEDQLANTKLDEKIGGDGETPRQAITRVKEAWGKLKKEGKADTVAVQHSGIMKIVEAGEKHGWDNYEQIWKDYNAKPEAKAAEIKTFEGDNGVIHITRHGESQDGKDGLLRTPETPLSEQGQQEAKKEIPEAIKEAGITPAEIVSDEQNRTRTTAESVKEALQEPKILVPNPESHYRKVDDAGFQDILDSGLVRPRQKKPGEMGKEAEGVSMKKKQFQDVFFAKGKPHEGYKGDYVVETTGIKMVNVGHGNAVGVVPYDEVAKEPIKALSINDPRVKIYKKDANGQYAEIDKETLKTQANATPESEQQKQEVNQQSSELEHAGVEQPGSEATPSEAKSGNSNRGSKKVKEKVKEAPAPVAEKEKPTEEPESNGAIATEAENSPDADAPKKEFEDKVAHKEGEIKAVRKNMSSLETEMNKHMRSSDAQSYNESLKKYREQEALLKKKQRALEKIKDDYYEQNRLKKTADSIREFGQKVTKAGEGMVGAFPGISPKLVGKFIDKVADLVETVGNIHLAISKAVKYLKQYYPADTKDLSDEHILDIKEQMGHLVDYQKQEPKFSQSEHEIMTLADDYKSAIEEGEITRPEAIQEVLEYGLPDNETAKILNYLDWHTQDQAYHNSVELRKPEHSADYLDKTELTNSNQISAYISGKTLGDVFGQDVQFDIDSKETQLQQNLVSDMAGMLGKAKYHTGSDDVLVYGTDMLGAIKRIPDSGSVKKVVAVSALSNELHAERLRMEEELSAAEMPTDRRNEVNTRMQQLNKMIAQAEIIYRDTTSGASDVLNAARANRIFRNTFHAEMFAEKILSETQKAQKEEVEKGVHETNVPDEIADNSPTKTPEQVKEDVAAIEKQKAESAEGKKVDADISESRKKEVSEKKKEKVPKDEMDKVRQELDERMKGKKVDDLIAGLKEKINKKPC